MMRVTAPVRRRDWQAVLSTHPQALPEQAIEWMDAVTAAGPYRDASRLYEFSDGRRFVLPLVRRRGPFSLGGWYGSFPPAWGMGGLIGAEVDAEVVAEVVADLRGLDALRISLCPDPLQAPAWRGVRGPGIVALPRRAHVIDLSESIDAVRARLSRTTRHRIRRADKHGVRVVRDHDGGLLPVYHQLRRSALVHWAAQQHEPLALARLRAWRRDPPEKLYRLAARMGDAFALYVAFVEGQPAAAAILLFGRTAHDISAVMDRAVAAGTCANDLLQWTAIADACELGCSAYHLGETGQSASLARFKERFAADPVDYTQFRIERFPFTRADTVARTSVKKMIGFRDV